MPYSLPSGKVLTILHPPKIFCLLPVYHIRSEVENRNGQGAKNRELSLPNRSLLLMALGVGATCAACPNAFLYGNPVCQNNGTLHIGSRGEGTNSCAYCDCPLGWGGVDCNRCFDVSVCPNKTVYGVVRERLLFETRG